MESGLQIAFAIQFVVLGAAHVLQPRAMIDFFVLLASKREAGVIVIALLSLTTGSVLVAFHNVWSGVPVVLTIFGWAQLMKGTVYLLYPAFGLKQISRVTPERTNLFRLPGIPLLIFGLLLGWNLVA